MKKKVVIALAILLTVGSVTAGSIAMSNSSDTDKKPDKKIEVVSNEEDTEEQTDESGTEEEDVLPENETEEQSEADNTSSASEEEKADKTDKKKEKQDEKKSEKKDGKSSKKSDVQKVSSTSDKPSANKPSSSKPNKPSGNTNTNKPSKPSHTHNWVASTKQIHHDAIGHNERVKVKDAWIEKIPRYKDVAREICNTCEADITGNIREHIKKHMLAGEGGSHRTEYKKVFSHYEEVNHPAEYMDKWVVDKPAWTEKITSYHCSCGAKK